jgi:soluble lytic murein transglycosylase-like protein
MRTPQGPRALALIEVGQDLSAEEELRHINPAQPETARALLAVSLRSDMPALAMQLADQLMDSSGRHYDAALYPVPSWEPQGGYSIDRALVLALIRQESKFSAKATSGAGARGLMQIMPGTARFVSDGTGYGGLNHQLFKPALNIALGQNYLTHLMGVDSIRENLFLLVAAYNGGPGNLAHWQRSIKHGDDPLLFLESIPNRQTRQFVERVLANYWIYRDELGQPSPALDAIAAGKWPTYQAMDGYLVPTVARNGRN